MATQKNVIENSAGSVGIGTTSPTQVLELKKSTGSAIALLNYNDSVKFNINASSAGVGYVGMVSNHPLLFVNNDTERMRLDTSGNLGIGTSNPVYKLQVSGQTFLNNGTSNALQIQTSVADTTTRDAIYFYEDSGAATGRQAISWYNGNVSYYKARLWTEVGQNYQATQFGIDVADDSRNIATRLAIRNGNVGIGSTSPACKLDVAGTIRSTSSEIFGFGASDNVSIRAASSANVMGLYTSNSEKVRIDSNGNVGIGTTSPTSILHAYRGAASSNVIALQVGDNTNTLNYIPYTAAGGYNYASVTGGSALFNSINSTWWIGTHNGPAIRFTPNGTMSHINSTGTITLYVSGSGNVGINQTSPAYKLDVNGTGRFAGDLYSNGNLYIARAGANLFINGTNSDAELHWQANGTSRWAMGMNVGDGTENLNIYNYTTSTVNFSILKANGNVGIGNASPTAKLDIASTQANGIVMRYDTGVSYQAWIRPYWNSGTDTRIDFAINRTANVTPDVIMSVGYGGNVGVGTTAPAAKLDVVSGSIRAASSAYSGEIYFGTAAGDNTNVYLKRDNNYDLSLVQNASSGNALYLAGAGNVYLSIDSNNNETDRAFIVQNNSVKSGTELFRVNESGCVGIGTSSPSSLLNVSGTGTLGSVFQEKITNGTTTLALGTNATAAEVQSQGSVPLYLNYGGNNVCIVPVGSGNVGIGTTAPAAKLDVSGGSLSSVSGSRFTIASFTNNNGNASYLNIETTRFSTGTDWTTARTRIQQTTDVTRQAYIDFNPNGELYGLAFGTGAGGSSVNERMRILSNGNVGIGTTAPAAKLEITGGLIAGGVDNGSVIFYRSTNPVTIGATDSVVYVSDRSNADWGITVDKQGYDYGLRINVANSSTNALAIYDGSTYNARIYGSGGGYLSGNVGIGTSTLESGCVLTVKASNSTRLSITDGTTRAHLWPTGGNFYFSTETASDLIIITNASERMRILSSGNVGIGTTSPTAKLTVSSNLFLLGINAQRQYTYYSIGSANDDFYFRSSTTFANQGANFSMNLSRLNYQSAGSGNDLTDKVGIWLRGFYDNSGGGLPIYLGGYAYSSQIPAVTITGLNSDGGGGNLGIGTTVPLSKLNSYGSGSNLSLFRVDGGNGTLFEVTDNLSGSLFSVNDVSGLPLLEVFSNNRIVAGKYGSNALVVSGSSVGIGTTTPAYKLQVNGSFAATTKSFVIQHPDPNKSDKQLVHGVLEGPEHSVFVRGILKDTNIIQLPDYWQHLVHEDSVSVTLTSNKYYQQLYVKNVTLSTIEVGSETDKPINCYYYIVGERKDIDKLVPEI